MVRQVEKIGDNRYREDFGRYFEEFTEGDVYEHRPGRTITQTDNIWMTLLTMNYHPLHFDSEYGKNTEFGQNLVNSAITLAIVGGMSVTDVSYKGVANLGWDKIRLPNPVFPGDTIYAESEVMKKRESESRPDDGIVTVKTVAHNQNEDVVCEYERTILIPKKGKGTPDS